MNNSITKDRVENYLICTAHCLEKVDLTVSMDSVLSQWALLMLGLKNRPGNNFSDVLAVTVIRSLLSLGLCAFVGMLYGIDHYF